MIQVLRAEWTKLRTVAGPAWLLAATMALTAAISVAADAATRCPAGATCPVDTAKLTLTGVQFGQAIVAILAVLMLGSEYSTGMIRVTLAATPRRWTVLAAKAVVLGAVTLAAAAVVVFGSMLAGRLILPGHGFTTGRGYLALSLATGSVARAAIGSVLYLTLVALLSPGVAAVLRDSAAAIGVVLGLLYLFPIITVFLGNPTWQHRIERYTPMDAGLAIQATAGVRHLPIGPWVGLGVLAIWSAAALVLGALCLRLRDA